MTNHIKMHCIFTHRPRTAYKKLLNKSVVLINKMLSNNLGTESV